MDPVDCPVFYLGDRKEGRASSVGIFKQSVGGRNRVRIGLSYRLAIDMYLELLVLERWADLYL
jgi:hypothetical protein